MAPILGALMALAPLATDFYLPGLPALRRELDAGVATAQATVTVTLFGMGVGQLLFGPVSDALGRRRLAMIATYAHAVLSVGCALVDDIALLLALRLAQGLCGAAVMVVVMAMVRDLASGRAAGVLVSRLMLVMGVAPVLGPTLGGLLLLVTNWRGLFIALAIFGILIGLASQMSLPESLPPTRRRRLHPHEILASYRSVLGDPLYLGVLAIASMTSTAMFAFISASPFVYQEVYGLSEVSYAIAFGVNALCMVVGTQLNPLLIQRWTPPQILLGALIWMTLGATMAVGSVLLLDSVLAFAIPMGLYQIGLGLVNPSTQVIGLHQHGDHAGAAAAGLGAGRFMAAGLLAPVVGVFGKDALPLSCAMVLLALLAGVVMITMRGRAGRLDYA